MFPRTVETGETHPQAAAAGGDGVSDGRNDGNFIDPAGSALGAYDSRYVPNSASVYDRWEGEDRNLDGRRDPSETDPRMCLGVDSDGDGLADGWRDTNRDGVIDQGEEEGEVISPVANTWRSDPSSFDTDEDSLSDGQEVRGWEINIVSEKTKERVKSFRVTSDALIRDTEGDGLSDFDEFQNTANPRAGDTDGDGIPDKLEQPGGHWQIEGKDPEIKGITARAVIKFYQACIAGLCAPTPIPENAAVHLEITAMDNGLLHRVVVILGAPYAPQQGEFNTDVSQIGKEQMAIFDFTVSLGDPRVYTIGFDIKVEVYDWAGNGISQDVHVDGLAEQFVKAILGALTSLVVSRIHYIPQKDAPVLLPGTRCITSSLTLQT